MPACLEPIELLKYCATVLADWPQVQFVGEHLVSATGECCYTYDVQQSRTSSVAIAYSACMTLRRSLNRDGMEVTQTLIRADRFQVWFHATPNGGKSRSAECPV